MAESGHLYQPVELHVPLTPQQRSVVFRFTGKQVTELALTADELQIVVSDCGPTPSVKLMRFSLLSNIMKTKHDTAK